MPASLSAFLLAMCVGQGVESRFDIRTGDGVVTTAAIANIREGFAVTTEGPKGRVVAGKELVSLHRTGAVTPAMPLRPSVLLTSGDHIPLDSDAAVRIEEETLRFELPKSIAPPNAKAISLRATAVSMLWFGAPEQSERPAELQHRVEHAPRKQDVVGLREGDRMEGTLLALNLNGAQVKAGTRRMEVPLKQVAYVAFNTPWQIRPGLKRPYAYVILDDGARLTLSAMDWQGGENPIVGKTLWGAEVQFPLARLVALYLRNGNATYLADLEPTVRSEGYVGSSWPLGRNTMPHGGPLVLKGESIDLGLGMHARTSAAYKLDGKARAFEALVGMPAGSDPRARVRFRILLDGKPSEGTPDKEWSVGDAPAWLRIDLRGVRELTLLADFGSFGDVEARAVWGFARLLRD